MRLMRTVGCLAVVTSALLGACGGGPLEVEEGLVGLWILPYQETPTIYGLSTAQVIFRADGTFRFQGTNPMSQAPLGEFVVQGTWRQAGDRVTLTSGDAARTWNVRIEGGEARFADPENGEIFRLLRPLPD